MKVTIILLASGYGRRFNGNKLLALIEEKPMFMHIVDKIVKVNVDKIILVTQYEEIKKSLENYFIEVIINENSHLGISSSIKLGIQQDKESDAYLFMVCDQPFIKEDTIRNLIDKFKESKKGIACVAYENNLGNPVIFHKRYLNDLMNLSGDKGGKCIVNRNLDDVEILKITDKRELIDIDTMEILNKMSK